jgi:hypothetical protein
MTLTGFDQIFGQDAALDVLSARAAPIGCRTG